MSSLFVIDQKIWEISNKKEEHWKLMNWVKKYKLLVVKAIRYNNCPYLEINDLWYALYLTFNSTQNQQVDVNILDKFPDKYSISWPPFLREEFIRPIAKCSNSFALGPNKLS